MARTGLSVIKLAFVLLASYFIATTSAIAKDQSVVFAPSSMTDVLNRIAADFKAKNGKDVSLSLAGTAQLARQLDHGAPADVFITADNDWMNWAIDRNLVVEKSVSPIAGNRLVLAVRNEVENWADVEGLLTTSRFAMAEPNAVPAGRYARQALKSLGLWEKASKQAVYGDNVRVVLRRLALGEVAAAIVYATDVTAEPEVKTIFSFSNDSHDAIVYWAGQVSQSKARGDFLNFLKPPSSDQVFKELGFLPATADAKLRSEGE